MGYTMSKLEIDSDLCDSGETSSRACTSQRVGEGSLDIDNEIAHITKLRSEPSENIYKALNSEKKLPISVVKMLAAREARGNFSLADSCHVLGRYLPVNGAPCCVDRMSSRAYVSQFSADGSLFVAGFQGSHIRIYDADNGWKARKDILARSLRWTITDTSLSPNQRHLEKLQNHKLDQPPEASSQSTIANSEDIYAQVLGNDRPGCIRGLGTGPTRKTLGVVAAHQMQTQAQAENVELGKVVKELLEKVNLLMRDRNSVDCHPSPTFVPSAASVAPMKQIQGKNVKLLDVGGAEVAIGIVISEDKERVVMGKVLGDTYYEVAVLHAMKPETPLFVKDYERKILKDAVGSHIVWLTDYVKVDGPKTPSSFCGSLGC